MDYTNFGFPQQNAFGQDLSYINMLRGNNVQTGNMPTTTKPTLPVQGGAGIMGGLGKAWDWLGEGGNLQTIADIGQTLAGLYMGNKQIKMGERALGLQENVVNNNLEHSIKSYNTKLADQAKARGYTQGQSDAEIQAHIDQNSLKRV